MDEILPPSEMSPPWVVEPQGWIGTEWIVRKSKYLESWRNWFLSLSVAEQENYQTRHLPPPDAEPFYGIFGRPDWSPAREAEKWRDNDGFLAPPWVAFPNIPRGSIGWRMGPGEDYWWAFVDWYKGLSESDRAQFRDKYPEPAKAASDYPWTGIYEAIGKQE